MLDNASSSALVQQRHKIGDKAFPPVVLNKKAAWKLGKQPKNFFVLE
jgi:hypothetical protein